MDNKKLNEAMLVPPIFANEEEMVQRWAQRCWLDVVEAIANIECCSMSPESRRVCYMSLIDHLNNKALETEPQKPAVNYPAVDVTQTALDTIKTNPEEINTVDYSADGAAFTFTTEQRERLQYIAGMKKD